MLNELRHHDWLGYIYVGLLAAFYTALVMTFGLLYAIGEIGLFLIALVLQLGLTQNVRVVGNRALGPLWVILNVIALGEYARQNSFPNWLSLMLTPEAFIVGFGAGILMFIVRNLWIRTHPAPPPHGAVRARDHHSLHYSTA